MFATRDVTPFLKSQISQMQAIQMQRFYDIREELIHVKSTISELSYNLESYPNSACSSESYNDISIINLHQRIGELYDRQIQLEEQLDNLYF